MITIIMIQRQLIHKKRVRFHPMVTIIRIPSDKSVNKSDWRQNIERNASILYITRYARDVGLIQDDEFLDVAIRRLTHREWIMNRALKLSSSGLQLMII